MTARRIYTTGNHEWMRRAGRRAARHEAKRVLRAGGEPAPRIPIERQYLD